MENYFELCTKWSIYFPDHITLEKYGWTPEPMQITECTYGLENHSLQNIPMLGKFFYLFKN